MTNEQMRAACHWTAEDKANLFAKFPRLLRTRTPTGCDLCSRGWKALLERAFAIAEPHAGVELDSLKQKWGSLRIFFDYHGGDVPSHLEDVVEEIKIASSSVCEACGELGDYARLNGGGIWVLCPRHLPDDAAFVPPHSP